MTPRVDLESYGPANLQRARPAATEAALGPLAPRGAGQIFWMFGARLGRGVVIKPGGSW